MSIKGQKRVKNACSYYNTIRLVYVTNISKPSQWVRHYNIKHKIPSFQRQLSGDVCLKLLSKTVSLIDLSAIVSALNITALLLIQTPDDYSNADWVVTVDGILKRRLPPQGTLQRALPSATSTILSQQLPGLHSSLPVSIHSWSLSSPYSWLPWHNNSFS